MNILRIQKMYTQLQKCVQGENFLIKLLKKSFSMRNTLQKYLNKFYKLLIIVTIINLKLSTEISNLRIFCLKIKKMIRKLKLQILVYQRFAILKILAKLKDSKQEQELHIIYLLKFQLEIMIKCVIYGQLDAYFIFYSVVILLFMEMTIKKFSKQFKKENTISKEMNGPKFLKKQKI